VEQPLNGEEVLTVEGEPNTVIIGPKPNILMVEDEPVKVAVMGEPMHRSFRRGPLGGRMGSLMGLLMLSYAAMGSEMMAGVPVTRDVPAPRKKCLECGQPSQKPFCCSEHAGVWRERKKGGN
jgi:hypothetical protein